jgi:hypothetical protein
VTLAVPAANSDRGPTFTACWRLRSLLPCETAGYARDAETRACGPKVEGLTDGLTLEDLATLRPDNPTIAELRTRWPVNTFAETDANIRYVEQTE